MVNVLNDCDVCAIGQLDKADAEECAACCEHGLCLFHQGVERGVDMTIRQAQKAWDIL